jgi:hypothetical protein
MHQGIFFDGKPALRSQRDILVLNAGVIRYLPDFPIGIRLAKH